mmetsp:Transcript_2702/g.4232  ORF Transcript_2702/g.4232 Transcript_2702/m.4232 type:complete len:234 (+) Transcript_2702:2693-3394(+)
MDDSLSEMTVTLEITADAMRAKVFSKLQCSSAPLAATAREAEVDSTKLWTVFDSLIFMSGNYQSEAALLKWQHSILPLSCLTTGLSLYLMDNKWQEVHLYDDKGYSLASGKDYNIFRYAGYNGKWDWGGRERTGAHITYELSSNGFPEVGDSTHYSMDEFMDLYTFDNTGHFKDQRVYPKEYHRSLAFRISPWVGGYTDDRHKTTYRNVIKCGNLLPLNFPEVVGNLKDHLSL